MVFLTLINVRCFRIAVAPCVLYIHPLASFRWSLYNVFSSVFHFCYRQRATRCHIFAVHCPLTVWFCSSLSSFAPCRLSFAGSMLTICNWLFPARCSRFTVSIFGCSSLVGGKSPCPRRLFLAVRCMLVTSSNSLIVVINCRLLSNNFTLLASWYSQLVTGPLHLVFC